MGPDADPWPTVEPHAAFYGLWPKFADPVGKGATPPRRERPTPHVCGWWTSRGPREIRIA
jgi:hypothetical protein